MMPGHRSAIRHGLKDVFQKYSQTYDASFVADNQRQCQVQIASAQHVTRPPLCYQKEVFEITRALFYFSFTVHHTLFPLQRYLFYLQRNLMTSQGAA